MIDGSTSDMMESSGVSDGKMARRLTGKAIIGLVSGQSLIGSGVAKAKRLLKDVAGGSII